MGVSPFLFKFCSQVNTMHRLFVALTLSDELKDLVLNTFAQYPKEGLRGISASNLHITGIFLGNVASTDLVDLKAELKALSERHEPFYLSMEAATPGPKLHRPRLIWTEITPSPGFSELVSDLRSQLSRFWSNPDSRPPLPHITMGRFRKNFKPPKDLPVIPLSGAADLEVASIELWESKPGPEGSVYTSLETWKFRQA